MPLTDLGYSCVAVLASLPLAILFLRSVSKILWATGLKAWLSVYTGMFGRSRITLVKKNFESLHLMNHGNGKWQYPFYMLLKFLLTCVVTISDTYVAIYFISICWWLEILCYFLSSRKRNWRNEADCCNPLWWISFKRAVRKWVTSDWYWQPHL